MLTRGFHGPSGHGRHQNPTGFGKKQGHYPTGFGWKNTLGTSVNQNIHKYWSFRTKHKVFMLTLTNDGGSVRICERTRLFGYEVAVTIDAVDWMVVTLEELYQKTGTQRVNLKRFFRNSTISCLLECFANVKGQFLKISVLRNNKFKMIIVPEEDKAKGWSELKECLNGIIKRKTRGSIEQSSQVKVNPKAGMSTTQRSWADVVKQTRGPMMNTQHNTVKTKGTVRKRDSGRIEWKDLYPEINPGFKPKNFYPRKRFVQPNFFEYMRSKALSKEWNLAIILTRNNTHADWCTIFYNLSRELERKLVVSQLFDDRCIIWCKNELERDELIKMHSMRVPGAQSLVTFLPWSWENQKDNVKVECRGSWIGIQGLPLNLWNMKSFRKIGARCGGLLDVDKDTAEASFLSHLRLQLMGDDFGFIPETISLNHDNMNLELKLFKLNDLSYRFHGCFNTCWYQDFDHDKWLGDGETNTEKEKEDGEDGRDEDETVGEAGSDERHDGVERLNQSTCWSRDVEQEKEVDDGVAIEGVEKDVADDDEAVGDLPTESSSLGRSLSVPEKAGYGGNQAMVKDVAQPRALHPKKTFLTCGDGSAAESEDCILGLDPYEASELCHREQGKVVDKGLLGWSKNEMRLVVGWKDNGPKNLILNNNKLVGNYTIQLNGMWYYQNGPYKLILDHKKEGSAFLNDKIMEYHSEAQQGRYNKESTAGKVSSIDKMAVCNKKNPVQVINDFFEGILRSVRPKKKEAFTAAIINFWADIEEQMKDPWKSVLHNSKETEYAENNKSGKELKTYRRKRRSRGMVGKEAVNKNHDNFQLEELGDDVDPIEEEIGEYSSESEASEDDCEDCLEAPSEENEDFLCDIKELWCENEIIASKECGELGGKELSKEESSIAPWVEIMDTMAEMGMNIIPNEGEGSVGGAKKGCRKIEHI
ncbi:hypothetical protein F8388_022339 [Cannabis sativa]|uniref:DUF4283 domain-containing protein n=1 Tax=Cannabis sativa TaxID=3483 RepID=A0A7J6G6M7_CANSA|nr:hypothetical protein F8388_022339 [Cannabis sativa]